MYSSRGSNPYGQQSYASQQSYAQNSGSVYSGIGGADGGAQLSVPSRHVSMLSGSQEAEMGGYRTAAQYGAQYSSVYGSSSLSNAQQIAALTGKAAGSSSLQSRAGYASAVADSPKFASGDYLSSDYSSVDRRNYGEPQSGYIGRELQSDSARRYADSLGISHQHQPDRYDQIDQAALLRQQQLLQSAALDGSSRPTDYLAARGAPIRHAAQDLTVYGGRMDADPRNLSTVTGPSYGGQHQSSILGAGPRRNVDELMYSQGSATGGYGVSLPPGRDYVSGKGLRGTTLESDYQSSLLSRSTHPSVAGARIDERKDDRAGFRRDHELREEERRREHAREREKERDREKERERARERERIQERRHKERERERERDRERERERERERKRTLEIKRERTPPRISKDRHAMSSIREEKSIQRDSPRQEALHRRLSPLREKRREYICKVYPYCLVEVERDYLSISKRYPRLFISPEFSKVVVHWPNGNVKLSYHTPVSFEHGFVEMESKSELKTPSFESLAHESEKPQCGATVWNAKVILMSGISKEALEDLSSDRSFGDRIPHINNVLRFAILKKDRSFMAIGGPWNASDGGDPSVDDSSLIRTALRHADNLTQLQLHACQHWNRFLEIHYDRVGKDGLFSHREITVLFVPDLSHCLPSLDTWREQWLAHKKSLLERDKRLSMKKEKKSGEKEEAVKVKNPDSQKNVKEEEKQVKQVKQEKKESQSSPSERKAEGREADNEGSSKVKDIVTGTPKNKDEGGLLGDNDIVVTKENETDAAASGPQKAKRKRIVKKVVKQKVGDKKIDGADTINNVQQEGSSADPVSVKTSGKKKIVKKVPAKAQAKSKKVGESQTEGKTGNDQEDKPQDKVDAKNNSVQESGVKGTGKKKIIKKVAKKKASTVVDKVVDDANNGESNNTRKGGESDQKKEESSDAQKGVEQGDGESKSSTLKSTESEKQEPVSSLVEKDGKVGRSQGKGGERKNSGTDAIQGKGSKDKNHDGNKEKVKDEKEKKGKDEKDGLRSKSSKVVVEKAKPEEPPKHPGLILQTEWTDSKLRSMSLSLDSLLDYNDKDIEESTFELSLFAESLNEMLQYQMGSRLLAFLQKLRFNFVSKRNQRKRQRDENLAKEADDKMKRTKTADEVPVQHEPANQEKGDGASAAEHESVKSEKEDGASAVELESAKSEKEEGSNAGSLEPTSKESADGGDDSKTDEDMDDYDPEEDVDEDEGVDDANHQNDASMEAGDEKKETEAESKPEKEETEVKEEIVEEDKIVSGDTDTKENQNAEKDEEVKEEDKEVKAEGEKKVAKPEAEELALDTDLLQAFRFFDRNRMGYIKVEDMRLILHNLGKFLSHREVKELVQSALFESNTARDNRILYGKLVRKSGI